MPRTEQRRCRHPVFTSSPLYSPAPSPISRSLSVPGGRFVQRIAVPTAMQCPLDRSVKTLKECVTVGDSIDIGKCDGLVEGR